VLRLRGRERHLLEVIYKFPSAEVAGGGKVITEVTGTCPSLC